MKEAKRSYAEKRGRRDRRNRANGLVTAEDAPGEHHGSPGLFGNAVNAEIFYDNLTVTANPTDE